MRKKFLYFVLIPALLIGLLLYLFLDRWVEAGLELAGEKIVGAKVEIDHLHLSLFPLGMRWAAMHVADPKDPWRNLFETGEAKFAMDMGQLLRGKVIVQTMEVNSLILGTKRTTDGSLPKGKEAAPAPQDTSTFSAQAQSALGATSEKAPAEAPEKSHASINADSLLKLLDIHSLKHLDSLKAQALSASAQWNNSLADFEASKKKLADAESAVKSINVSQLNTIPAITQAISTVEASTKAVNEVSTAFSARKASIESDVASLSASSAMVDDIAASDFARLKSMARLPNLSSPGIARLLVGDEVIKRATTYLHWIDMARSHIKNSSTAPPMESPPRMKGQDIHFPLERAYPKFWIMKMLISGGTDTTGTAEAIRAKGEIDNISNDQSVTHVPMTATLEGVEGGARSFSLHAMIDRTKPVPYDEYDASIGGTPLAAFSIGNEGFLAAKMVHARMSSSVKIVVPGSGFDANSKTELSGFALQFASEPKSTLERVIREVLQNIQQFQVSFRLWKSGSGFDLALSTDLDSQIADHLSGVLGAELTKAQNDLKSKFDAMIGPKKAEVEKLVSDKTSGIEKQLGANQSLITDKLSMLDAKKKELTDRLANQQKGKVNDLLKGILK